MDWGGANSRFLGLVSVWAARSFDQTALRPSVIKRIRQIDVKIHNTYHKLRCHCVNTSHCVNMHVWAPEVHIIYTTNVEALHGSHVFCLSSHVRWRCVRAQRENTKRILLLFSYGNIICRHLQICFFLDYTTWWIYILSHFGSILLCNSNPDADR